MITLTKLSHISCSCFSHIASLDPISLVSKCRTQRGLACLHVSNIVSLVRTKGASVSYSNGFDAQSQTRKQTWCVHKVSLKVERHVTWPAKSPTTNLLVPALKEVGAHRAIIVRKSVRAKSVPSKSEIFHGTTVNRAVWVRFWLHVEWAGIGVGSRADAATEVYVQNKFCQSPNPVPVIARKTALHDFCSFTDSVHFFLSYQNPFGNTRSVLKEVAAN